MRNSSWLGMAAFALVLAGGAPALAQPNSGARPAPDGPRVGELAPDFELPRLETLAGGAQATVKLSQFRGKSPVVLVFASYT